MYDSDGQGGWTETVLAANEFTPEAELGSSVALAGDRIVAGAPGGFLTSILGSVSVFEEDGTGSWTETVLRGSDGSFDDGFGSAVAAAGDRLAVGAAKEAGSTDGALYIYEPVGTGGWSETKIESSDLAGNDQFGYSVAMSGDRIVVGARWDDDNGFESGSVYAYEPDGTGGWTETKLTAADGAAGDRFGWSVAVSGDRIVIGAPFDDDNGSGSGSAYVFDLVSQPNEAPTADPGGPYTVDEGSTVVLDGTGSTDADGTIVAYEWAPADNLDDSTLAQPTFTGVDDDVVTMTLNVTDDDGATDTATTTVTVNNAAPTVESGTDQTVDDGVSVSLDPATFTDPGTEDTHTATIDWGDGSVETGTVDQLAGTVDGSHVYAGPGTYTVSVTVTDDDGGMGSDTFTVTVLDITPPVLTVPGDFEVEATGPDGGQVDYVVTAVDDADPAPVVDCAPAVGTLFPLGETTVTCTATDAAGNASTASFTVTVVVGVATFDGFADLIRELDLPRGTERAFLSKVEEAQAFFAEGDTTAALESLTAVINHANATEGKKLTPAKAEAIRSAAQALIAAIEGGG